MEFSDIRAFTEDSLSLVKEFSSFLREKQELELHYSRNLSKSSLTVASLCNKYLYSRKEENQESVSQRSNVLKTTIWGNVVEHIKGIRAFAQSQQQNIKQIEATLLNPFEESLREREVAIRAKLVVKLDGYIHDLRECQVQIDKVSNSYQAAKLQSAQVADTLITQNKDSEKKKFYESDEKELKLSSDLKFQLKQQEITISSYYGHVVPQLILDLMKEEGRRFEVIKECLVDLKKAEKQTREHEMSWSRSSTLLPFYVSEDISKLSSAFVLNKPEPKSMENLYEREIRTKSGRLLVKRGPHSAWVNQYCILVAEDYKLFCFDSEDRSTQTECIDLQECRVYGLHESFYKRDYAFQLIFKTKQDGKQILARGATVEKTYYLIAQSFEDKMRWLAELKKLCFCCVKCAVAFGCNMSKYQGALNPSAEYDLPNASLDVNLSNKTNARRRLDLKVLECRDLIFPNKKGAMQAYCTIQLSNIDKARTQTTSTDPFFWADEFNLTDLPPCHTKLQIILINAQTQTEIGQAFLNLNTLKERKKYIEWLPLKIVDGEAENVLSAGIKIECTFSSIYTVPFSVQDDLLQTVSETSLETVRSIYPVFKGQFSTFTENILNMLVAQKREITAINELLSLEIEKCTDPHTIFRENTLTTQLMDAYMRMAGHDYLRQAIGVEIRALCLSKEAIEVDPYRVSSTAQRDKIPQNWSRLLGFVENVWNSIILSAGQCPKELTLIFEHIRNCVIEKFNDEQVANNAICSFIFLRFFCPAIIAPKLFGLVHENPDFGTTRTLVLISKVLKNMSTFGAFEEKQDYMMISNGFVYSQAPNMRSFYAKISKTAEQNRNITTFSEAHVSLDNQVSAFALSLLDAKETIFALEKFNPKLKQISEIIHAIDEVYEDAAQPLEAVASLESLAENSDIGSDISLSSSIEHYSMYNRIKYMDQIKHEIDALKKTAQLASKKQEKGSALNLFKSMFKSSEKEVADLTYTDSVRSNAVRSHSDLPDAHKDEDLFALDGGYKSSGNLSKMSSLLGASEAEIATGSAPAKKLPRNKSDLNSGMRKGGSSGSLDEGGSRPQAIGSRSKLSDLLGPEVSKVPSQSDRKKR